MNVKARISSLTFVITAILIALPSFSADLTAPVIRVGLIHTIGKPYSLTISSKGSFDIVDTANPTAATTVDSQKVSFSAKGHNIEVSIAGNPTGSFKGPLRLVPKNAETLFEVISPRAKYARYRHVLEIMGGSALTVVNELPLEDYVKGVVPTEVAEKFHLEAQKALVVAIRTYALKSLKRHASSGFNLCGSTHCQGFAGASREAPWVNNIVDATRGQIIIYKDEPIAAVYSTDCGGVTQNNEDAGFGKAPWPYLRSVVDNPSGQRPEAGSLQSAVCSLKSEDYCAGCQYHTWNKIYTVDELDHAFSRSFYTRKIGKFQSMEFSDFDFSDRVKTIIVKGDKGECRISGNQFRDMFGPSVIKSTRITMTVSPEGKYVIDGKGYGHGVGLCAFGANGLAKLRKEVSYIDILKHYYTGVEIKTISD